MIAASFCSLSVADTETQFYKTSGWVGVLYRIALLLFCTIYNIVFCNVRWSAS